MYGLKPVPFKIATLSAVWRALRWGGSSHFGFNL